MKLKNILLTGLSFVLVAAVAIGGTLAYLTSTDDDVNVMTLGNVSIKQHEYERVVNTDGTFATKTIDNVTSYVLKDFTQGKPLLPSAINTTTWEGWDWDSTVVRMTQVDSYGSMQVFKAASNAQDKFVTVENTGDTDAYIRTLVAIEIGSTDGSLIGTSYHSTWTDSDFDPSTTNVSDPLYIQIDGKNYMLQEYIYAGGQLSDGSWRHGNGILPAGDTSYPNLSQVYIKSAATNEDMKALDGNGNGTLDILVLSQAVQTEGFADAKTALDTAFGKSADKAAEWFGGMGKVQFVEVEEQKAQIDGEVAEEILNDLKAGNDLIVDEKTDILMFDTNAVDAKGATVTVNGTGSDAYGYLAFLPDAGEDVTVSNLNVTGSGFVEIGHYGMGGGNYTATNIKIENLQSTLANGDKGFTLGCAFMAFGDVTLNDCVMTGTTAADGIIAVDLACGQAWSGYTDDNDNKISTTINGGEYGTVYCWSHSIVTVDGADIDTMYVAPIKGTVTIKAGSNVGTINVEYGNLSTYATAANLAKLVIEDGATVDAIVFGGNSYTVAQWNAYVASL